MPDGEDIVARIAKSLLPKFRVQMPDSPGGAEEADAYVNQLSK